MEDFNDIEVIKEEKPSIIKKIFIIIIAVFLIILVLTFLLTDSLIRNIFTGLIQSNTIKENIVEINSTNKLVFNQDTYAKLLEIYDSNIGREFKVCLNGNIENGDYYINEVYVPETYLQKHNEVIAEPCSNITIVDMHSHPLKHCIPSEQDFISFNAFKELNNNAIMSVMCERGRFNFYV